ncbi:LysR family transcriptional regulator [Cnuibacter physcomitrellae]|uniref:LysR family transcriptional regulator n=1 Tax=Cnuibacter physcomitrellae TaxID=1619308 RepID=A0A1X9LGI0_9MICO|nr:LysR family transcriptional regulator [Cnuibacter physcomitrellae]ARJ04284.1 LysR family transcriptional regulator [Cnuibacter physcomitrellae]GGI40683.1 LysR family transcriptional regulator [Cnuibacter physcomitrellae]
MTETTPLSRLDLNLLVALDALLTERSVTRAAERLHLTQPALSASLARLRTHFGDPILARRGNTYELTPFALRLSEHTTTALESARRVFESQAMWSPEQSSREFSVYGSDYGFATIGTVAATLAAERAPGVRFRFILHTPTVVEDAPNKLRSADAMLLPHGFLTDMPYVDLWHDDWYAVVSAENRRVGERLTMDDLAESAFVMTYSSRSAFTSAARQMQQLGIEPHVDVVVESFLAIPFFVLGSDRVGLIQGALTPYVSALSGLRIVRLPFAATPIMNALWWHPVHGNDPEHAWMRGLFAEAGRRLEVEERASA